LWCHALYGVVVKQRERYARSRERSDARVMFHYCFVLLLGGKSMGVDEKWRSLSLAFVFYNAVPERGVVNDGS